MCSRRGHSRASTATRSSFVCRCAHPLILSAATDSSFACRYDHPSTTAPPTPLKCYVLLLQVGHRSPLPPPRQVGFARSYSIFSLSPPNPPTHSQELPPPLITATCAPSRVRRTRGALAALFLTSRAASSPEPATARLEDTSAVAAAAIVGMLLLVLFQPLCCNLLFFSSSRCCCCCCCCCRRYCRSCYLWLSRSTLVLKIVVLRLGNEGGKRGGGRWEKGGKVTLRAGRSCQSWAGRSAPELA